MKRALAVGLVALALLAGCATTRIISSWRDPADSGGPLTKVLVFVAARDEGARRFAEDQAVRSLPRGTRGVPSYTLFTQQDMAQEHQEKLRARLVAEGFDGAVTTRVVAVEQNQVYVPPQTYITPGVLPPPAYLGPGVVPPGPYYGSFYYYYPYAYSQVYTSPGYSYQETRHVVETLVYRLPEGRPVWIATAESVSDPGAAMVQELVRVIEGELQKQGLVGAR